MFLFFFWGRGSMCSTQKDPFQAFKTAEPSDNTWCMHARTGFWSSIHPCLAAT